ncbi:MAG: hypothetical protein AAB863_01130 [Patescibacteria group bacterium]
MFQRLLAFLCDSLAVEPATETWRPPPPLMVVSWWDPPPVAELLKLFVCFVLEVVFPIKRLLCRFCGEIAT